jgi:hypothetical protein
VLYRQAMTTRGWSGPSRDLLALVALAGSVQACAEPKLARTDEASVDASGGYVSPSVRDAAAMDLGCNLIGCGEPASFAFDLPLTPEAARRSKVTFCRNHACVTATPDEKRGPGVLLAGRSDAGSGDVGRLTVTVRPVAAARDLRPRPSDQLLVPSDVDDGGAVGGSTAISQVRASYMGDDVQNGDVYTLRVDGPDGGTVLAVRQAVAYHETIRNPGPGPSCVLRCLSISP